MRRIISIFLILLLFVVSSTSLLAQEENNNYDPNRTMLALNMAIISVNKNKPAGFIEITFLYSLYNVMTLGGTVNWFMDTNNMKDIAGERISAMQGLGWLNLSKGSEEERLATFNEALKIRNEIPKNSFKWYQNK